MSNQANRFSSKYNANTSVAKSTDSAKMSAGKAGAAKDKKPTTHYMVTGGKEDRQFVNGLFITEANGFEGLQVSIPEDVTLAPGVYFINRKKDKSTATSA